MLGKHKDSSPFFHSTRTSAHLSILVSITPWQSSCSNTSPHRVPHGATYWFLILPTVSWQFCPIWPGIGQILLKGLVLFGLCVVLHFVTWIYARKKVCRSHGENQCGVKFLACGHDVKKPIPLWMRCGDTCLIFMILFAYRKKSPEPSDIALLHTARCIHSISCATRQSQNSSIGE